MPGVDRDLDVVAHADFGVRGHRGGVGIGQRDLVLAGPLQTPDHHLVVAMLSLQGRDLFGEILGVRPAVRRAVLGVAPAAASEIIVRPFVGGADELAWRAAGVVAVLVVGPPDGVPSIASSSRPKSSSPRRNSKNRRKTARHASPAMLAGIQDPCPFGERDVNTLLPKRRPKLGRKLVQHGLDGCIG